MPSLSLSKSLDPHEKQDTYTGGYAVKTSCTLPGRNKTEVCVGRGERISKLHSRKRCRFAKNCGKVMDLPPTQVVMPFRPLLKQITNYLNFPDPDYQFVDEPGSIACVVVRRNCGPIASVYIGGYTSSIEESCEVPARKAVYDLMKKYEIVFEDVTYLRKQMYDRCGQLFWFKKEELERIEKEESKVCMNEDLCLGAEDNHKKIVVDFVVILRAIFKIVEIRCTPIETIEHSPDEYTSWFTVMPHKEGIGFRCLFSDYCRTVAVAKQSLARKAVDYLSDVFNLVIVDANYKVTTARFDAILCTLERESYLSVKERVLGIKEDLEPSTVLIEQDCLTPLGQEFQVPVAIPPALICLPRSAF
uniref:Uncharacterized protein n=1 Tax=Chenopodium quinoa TaxID=63459 RepID=A0A803MJ22_CHEQI